MTIISPEFKRALESEILRLAEQQNKAFASALRPLGDVLGDISDLERALNQIARSVKIVGKQQGLQSEAGRIEQTLKSQSRALRNAGDALGGLA